ncbi:MAG: hypothetical protein ACM3PE_04465 [Deltaproteobacteria bacterium]
MVAILTSFILRYYFFLDDEADSLQNLINEWDSHSIISCEQNIHARLADNDPIFYHVPCQNSKLTALAIRLSGNPSDWPAQTGQLDAWETQAGFNADDFMGKLTVLCGIGQPWEDLFEQACTLVSCQDPTTIPMSRGTIVNLSNNWTRGETWYLCGLEEPEQHSTQFLFRRLPLLHGNIIQLHVLDGLLHDRDMAIRQEKDELDRKLIGILHAKLVMTQATLTVTEELEKEIEGLSTAYGMLAGDHNLIIDGIKRLESQLATLERQFRHEPGLELPPALLDQLTGSYQQRLENLHNTLNELKMVLENYRAAIEVVQSKIDIINSRTNIATQEEIRGLLEVNTAMQKQSLVYQYAAGLIEFIVLAYYSHTLWSHLNEGAYAAIPKWIQFLVVLLFSGNTVWVTHLIAEYAQGEKHVRRKLILAAIPLMLILALVIVGSIMFAGHGGAAAH